MSITLEQSYIFSALQGGQGPEFGFELKAGHTKKCIFIFVPGQRRLTHGEQRDQKTTKRLPKDPIYTTWQPPQRARIATLGGSEWWSCNTLPPPESEPRGARSIAFLAHPYRLYVGGNPLFRGGAKGGQQGIQGSTSRVDFYAEFRGFLSKFCPLFVHFLSKFVPNLQILS